MAKAFKSKSTDNAAQLARDGKRRNRLNSIRNELEAGRISSFEQIFAIMSETSISTEIGISYYAFKKRLDDPGEFTVNEMMRLASLFGIKYDVMADFIRDRIKERSKSKIFKD